MADIFFKCPHCSKHLAVNEVAQGKVVKCVDCGKPIQVPMSVIAFKCPSCSCDLSAPSDIAGEVFNCSNCKGKLSIPTKSRFRRCPACNEAISEDDAVVCVSCGLDLRTGKPLKSSEETGQPSKPRKPSVKVRQPSSFRSTFQVAMEELRKAREALRAVWDGLPTRQAISFFSSLLLVFVSSVLGLFAGGLLFLILVALPVVGCVMNIRIVKSMLSSKSTSQTIRTASFTIWVIAVGIVSVVGLMCFVKGYPSVGWSALLLCIGCVSALVGADETHTASCSWFSWRGMIAVVVLLFFGVWVLNYGYQYVKATETAKVEQAKAEAAKVEQQMAEQKRQDKAVEVSIARARDLIAEGCGDAAVIGLAEALKENPKASRIGDATALLDETRRGLTATATVDYLKKIKDTKPSEMIGFVKKYAELGVLKAQCSLGVYYFQGEGVEQNVSEAVKWYRKAAEQGYAPAQYKLGCCFKYGSGVNIDEAEAVKWFQKAVEQGDEDAKQDLTELKERQRVKQQKVEQARAEEAAKAAEAAKIEQKRVEQAKVATTMGDDQYFAYLKTKYDNEEWGSGCTNLMSSYLSAYPSGKHGGEAKALVETAYDTAKRFRNGGKDNTAYEDGLREGQSYRFYMDENTLRMVLRHASSSKGYVPSTPQYGDFVKGFHDGSH